MKPHIKTRFNSDSVLHEKYVPLDFHYEEEEEEEKFWKLFQASSTNNKRKTN